MLKKSITYVDFNGDEQTEDFYFNLTKAELIEMELSGPNNSFRASMQKIIDSNNGRIIMQEFKRLIAKSYGQRSEDGKRFIKSEEIARDFEGTGAYDVLFIELTTDAEAASAWVRGVVPQDLSNETGITDPTKTPSQLARERSEAQMQGHKSVTTKTEPVLPTTTSEDEAARERRKADLQRQLAELD